LERSGSALLLVLLLAFTLFPLFWMVSTSLKTTLEATDLPPSWLPLSPTLDNYRKLFTEREGFVIFVQNSFIVCAATTAISTLLSVLGGYALSRFDFRLNRVLLSIILVANIFPMVLLLISLYEFFARLQLLDTYTALVLSFTTFALPFAVWMMKGFIDSVPKEIEEAAQVDGCSRLKALFSVVLPIITPGTMAVAVFSFLAAWNNLLFPLALTSSLEKRTVTVGLVLTYVGETQTRWAELMAASFVVTLPVVIAFILVERFMVKGLAAGAVKG